MAQRKPGLGFILLTLFLDILGIGLIVPIVPSLVETFVGTDPSTVSFYLWALTSSYALMQFVFSPILGSLSDRSGRRSILLISVFGQGAAYVLLALSRSLEWLFIARFLAGITSASIGTATAYIADVSPPEKRAQSFGLVGMAFGLGFIIGPIAGGFLGKWNVHAPFAVSAVLCFANGFYGLLVLPESLPPDKRRPFSWSRANPVGALLALKRYPAVTGLIATLFLVSLAQRGLESVWVQYTGVRYGWDPSHRGMSLGAVGLGAAIVQGFVVRRVVPAIGERRALLIGMTSGMIAFTLYGFASSGWMVYAIIPIGAFAGLSAPSAQGIMSRAVSPSEQGLLQGGVVSLQSVTQLLGPFVGILLFGFFTSDKAPAQVPGATFFLGAFFILLAVLLALRTFAKTPELSKPRVEVISS